MGRGGVETCARARNANDRVAFFMVPKDNKITKTTSCMQTVDTLRKWGIYGVENLCKV